MPTVTQFRNEAQEALAAAQSILGDATKGAQSTEYKAAMDHYFAKKAAFEAARTHEAEQKALGTPERETAKPSEMRNEKDADWIDTKDGPDKDDPDGVMIKSERGGMAFMPYARAGREGWIKGYPVSAQHPSILKRLPADLARKKALEEKAFAIYLRRGLKAFDRDYPELYPHLKDLQEDTDTEGGFLVPTDQRTDILVPPGTPGGVMRGISSQYNTTRDGGTWPRLSTDITLAPVAEEAAFPESDPAFGQVPFTIHKVGRAVDLSVELLADSATNLPALLGERFAAAKGRYEDQQGIEGDGSTEPLGLRTAGWATISDITDLLTLAAPTAVEWINAFYELPAQYRANSSWFMTSSLFARIVQVGSTAAGIHLIEMMGDAVTPRLLGRPVYFFDGTGWDDAATIGANEEVGAIGDFRNYAFIDRAGMTVERSDEVAFRTDQVVFKCRVRYDSLFLDNNAFRILKAAAS